MIKIQRFFSCLAEYLGHIAGGEIVGTCQTNRITSTKELHQLLVDNEITEIELNRTVSILQGLKIIWFDGQKYCVMDFNNEILLKKKTIKLMRRLDRRELWTARSKSQAENKINRNQRLQDIFDDWKFDILKAA